MRNNTATRTATNRILACVAALAAIAAACGGSGSDSAAPDPATAPPAAAAPTAAPTFDQGPAVIPTVGPAGTPDPAELPDPADGHTHDCPGPEWVQVSHDECELPADGADAVPTASPTPGSPEFPDPVDGHTHECPPGFDKVGHDQCVDPAEKPPPSPTEIAPAAQDPDQLHAAPDAPSCENGMVHVDLNRDGIYDTCGMPIPARIATAEVSAATSRSPASQPATDVAQRCFEHHKFGAQPVDVAKTADGQAVLAQTTWNWHDSIGCYLTLDDEALSVLRAAPAPQDLPSAPTGASRQCFEYHRFGENPVDVAKTADRQTVIARLSWGYHGTIGCYLVLDDSALATLQAAAQVALPGPGWHPDPTCRHEFRWWNGQAWANRVEDNRAAGQGVAGTDPIRRSEADGLARPGVGFTCAASDPVMDISGYKPDPTCRHDYRVWHHREWTVFVKSGDEETADFMLVADGYLALPQAAVDCDNRVASFAFPCDNPAPSDEPGVGIAGDGLPCATRLPEMGDPLFWNSGGPSNPRLWELAQLDSYYYKPEGVSDAEALGYITACLRGGAAGEGYRAYPVSYPSYTNGTTPPPGYTPPGEPLSVFQECADIWSKAAYAINFGGMGNSVACVYDAYLDYWLRRTSDGVLYEPDPIGVQIAEEHGLEARPYRVVGWAEACGSWVDPVPDRSFTEKCVWLRGHYIGHNEALQREAANGDCTNVRGSIIRLEQLTNVCIHRYMLVAMAKRWMRDEALQLGLGVPPDEYLPDYRGREVFFGEC